MTLKELYNLKLKEYKETGVREEPDKLLAMLLLPIKEDFESLEVEEGSFYRYYQEVIDENIGKIENDFELTRDYIIEKIEENVLCTDYEHDKIWHVFNGGFGIVHWAVMYRPYLTAEEAYLEMWEDKILLKNSEEKAISLQKTNNN